MKDDEIKDVGEEKTEPTEEKDEKQEITIDGLIGEIAEIKTKAEQESKRADEMTDMAQRLQAEFDNYRRRTNDNARKAREDATIDVIKKILPLTDVIAQATQMVADENVQKGFKMISDQITDLLKGYGVTEIEAEGKPFDPRFHEAIMQAPAEKEEDRDTVKTVFQKGYVMGDRVIRAARVIINK